MSFCLSLRPRSVLVRLSSIRPSCWSKSMLWGAWLVDRLPMLWRDEVTVVIFCEWRQWRASVRTEVDQEEETNLCLIFNIDWTVCLEQIDIQQSTVRHSRWTCDEFLRHISHCGWRSHSSPISDDHVSLIQMCLLQKNSPYPERPPVAYHTEQILSWCITAHHQKTVTYKKE